MTCNTNIFELASIAREFVNAETRYKKAIGKGECNDELHTAVMERERLFRMMAKASECGEN